MIWGPGLHLAWIIWPEKNKQALSSLFFVGLQSSAHFLEFWAWVKTEAMAFQTLVLH